MIQISLHSKAIYKLDIFKLSKRVRSKNLTLKEVLHIESALVNRYSKLELIFVLPIYKTQ